MSPDAALWAAVILFDSGVIFGVILCWFLADPGRPRRSRRNRGVQ